MVPLTWPLGHPASSGSHLFLGNSHGILVSACPCSRGPYPCPHSPGLPLSPWSFLLSLFTGFPLLASECSRAQFFSPSPLPSALTPLAISSSLICMLMTPKFISPAHHFPNPQLNIQLPTGHLHFTPLREPVSDTRAVSLSTSL